MKSRVKELFQTAFLPAFLLGLAQLPLARAADDSSLVQVRSTYPDELNHQPIRFTGVGSIVSRIGKDGKQKFFVLTSPHLTQGSELTLLSGAEEPLTLKSTLNSNCGTHLPPRLANNRTDVAPIFDPEVTRKCQELLERFEKWKGSAKGADFEEIRKSNENEKLFFASFKP